MRADTADAAAATVRMAQDVLGARIVEAEVPARPIPRITVAFEDDLLTCRFRFDPRLVDALKSLHGRWSPAKKVWTLENTPANLLSLQELGADFEQSLLPGLEEAQPGITETTEIPDSYLWLPTTTPRPHQLKASAWRRGCNPEHVTHAAAAFELGLGCGKTLICIQEIQRLLQRQPDAQILVLAPNSTLDSVWESQLHQHTGGQFDGRVWTGGSLDVTVLTGAMAKRRKLLRSEHHTVWVHNHESLPEMGEALAAHPWAMIILDEHSRFRNPTSARCKVLLGTGRWRGSPLTAPYRLALSGTPVIKRAQDIFVTYKWLGASFGNIVQFRLHHCIMGGYGGHTEIAIRPNSGLNQQLDAFRFVVPKKAVLDIPRSFSTRKVDLPDWQRKIYDRVRDDLIVRFEDEEHPIHNPLTVLMRLAQVTAGMEAVSIDQYQWYDENAKATLLFDEILPEMFEDGEQKVILWAWYRAEIEELHRMAEARGYRPVKFYGTHTAQDKLDRDKAVGDFRYGDKNLFIANTAAAGLGLNLPEAASMIYYTRSFDTEAMLQSLERNIRTDSKHTFYNVLTIEARNTVDQHITGALRGDIKTGSSLSSLPKDILGLN